MSEAAFPGARGSGLSLSQLLPRRVRAAARFVGTDHMDDMLVSRVTDDADECRRGDVFVARITARGDGHDDVRRAVARGAAGVIAERMVPTGGVPLCLVRSTDRALAHAAHALAGHPARRLRVIAVAGTSGKTTTAWLTASVLAEGGCDVGVLTDLGCLGADGCLAEPGDLSRADVFASRLARLADGGCTHAVVEVSSQMLAAHVLAGVACDTVVLTSVTPARLDLHGTPAAYRRIMGRILGALGPQGCLVADGGRGLEGVFRRVAADRPRAACLTAGTASGCAVRARLVERSLRGQTFLLAAGGDVMPVVVDAPVTSFARNAACAAAVGLRHGLGIEQVVRGIEAAGSVPGRVERLDRGQEAAVFLDTAANGHALSSTLASLRRLTAGRLAVIADEDAAAALAADGFSRRLTRWADATEVVPAGMLAAAASAPDLAAYARVDRLLSSLGTGDCLLVLGRSPAAVVGRGAVPLARAVDGWLQLAHPPRRSTGRRAA